MTLSEELTWRGFVNQTTFKNISDIDKESRTFYLGVDPSADSMTIGNLAAMMMVRLFIAHGWQGILLAGGATGLLGDPDGKKVSRDIKDVAVVEANTKALANQFKTVLNGQKFETVNNYDWFKDIGYMDFLRDVGWHVPMSQMMGREFVQSRLSEDGTGLNYAEFSYALIQGYDFLHLFRTRGATVQLCGADQWGNSIAGVELIRRIEGAEAHVWSTPLVINKSTGVKFGKSEDGAVWLDATKTTPTQFFQFWINLDDEGVEDYTKIYTTLGPDELNEIMNEHRQNPSVRYAQTRLAEEVTRLVHGEEAMQRAKLVTAVLTGRKPLSEASNVLDELRAEIPAVKASQDGSVIEALVGSGLASSNGEARRLIKAGAISLNGQKISDEKLNSELFEGGRALLRRGKAFKDSALIELT